MCAPSEQAMDLYRQMITVPHMNVPELWEKLAACFVAAGDPDSAADVFRDRLQGSSEISGNASAYCCCCSSSQELASDVLAAVGCLVSKRMVSVCDHLHGSILLCKDLLWAL